jgi:hypothetical protein
MDPIVDNQFEDAEEGNPVNQWVGGAIAHEENQPQHEVVQLRSPHDSPRDAVSIVSSDAFPPEQQLSNAQLVFSDAQSMSVTVGNSSVSDDSSVENDDMSDADPTAGAGFPFNIPAGVTRDDVLCGRGKGANNFIGNRRFRELVMKFRDTYSSSPRRADKRNICREIIDTVHSRGGRFLVKNDRTDPTNSTEWMVLAVDKILVKVSQALREGVAKWNKATQKFNEAKAKEIAALSTTPAMSLLAEISSIRAASF